MCVQNKKHLFKIEKDNIGNDLCVVPSRQNLIIHKWLKEIENKFNIEIDKYVIMPNHIHLILLIQNQNGTSKAPSPTNSIISHSISTFKRFVNKDIGHNIFQRSFHDHIIRDEKDYLKIWKYIDTNPQKWSDDCFYIE